MMVLVNIMMRSINNRHASPSPDDLVSMFKDSQRSNSGSPTISPGDSYCLDDLRAHIGGKEGK
jgi:hypothetical protein